MIWAMLGCAPVEEVVIDSQPPVVESVLPGEAYESAEACATCHTRQYEEWSQSMHAYAALSPVFDAMAGKAFRDSAGDVGSFCTGCH